MSINFQPTQVIDEAVAEWVKLADFGELKDACLASDPRNSIVNLVGNKAEAAYQNALQETKDNLQQMYLKRQQQLDEEQSGLDNNATIQDQRLVETTRQSLTQLLQEKAGYSRAIEQLSLKLRELVDRENSLIIEKEKIDGDLSKNLALHGLQSDIVQLKKDIASLRDEVGTTSKKVGDEDAAMSSINQSCQNVRAELHLVEGTLQQFKQAFDGGQRRMDSLEYEKRDLNSRLMAIEDDARELNRLRGELLDIQRRIEINAQHHVHTHIHVNSHSPTRSRARVEIHRSAPYSPRAGAGELLELERRILALESKHPNNMSERQQIQDQIAVVQASISSHQRHIAASRQQMQNYERDSVNRVRDQLRGFESQRSLQHEKIRQLNRELESTRSRLAIEENRLNTKQSQLGRLQFDFPTWSSFNQNQNEQRLAKLKKLLKELQYQQGLVRRECEELHDNLTRCNNHESDLQRVFVDVANRQKGRDDRLLAIAARVKSQFSDDLTQKLSSETYAEYNTVLNRALSGLSTEFNGIKQQIQVYLTAQLLINEINNALKRNMFDTQVSLALDSVFKLLEEMKAAQRLSDLHNQRVHQVQVLFQQDLLSDAQQAEQDMLNEFRSLEAIAQTELATAASTLSNELAQCRQMAKQVQIRYNQIDADINLNRQQQQQFRTTMQNHEQSMKIAHDEHQTKLDDLSARITRGCILVCVGLAAGLMAGAWLQFATVAVVCGTVAVCGAGVYIGTKALFERRHEQKSFYDEMSLLSESLKLSKDKIESREKALVGLQQTFNGVQQELQTAFDAVKQKELALTQAQSVVKQRFYSVLSKGMGLFENRVTPFIFGENRFGGLNNSRDLAAEQIDIRNHKENLARQMDLITPVPVDNATLCA